MGDRCDNEASHLEERQALGTWDERVKRSQMGILRLSFFEYFRLRDVYERRGNDFG